MRLNNQQLYGCSDSHIVWISDNVGIHKEMQPAWNALSQLALADGLSLKIASGFRSFNRQVDIWNRKYSGAVAVKNRLNENVDVSCLSDEEKVDAILIFSALPGTSRHHWGTDVDIYAENILPPEQSLQLEPWEYQKGGPFEHLNNWVDQHANSFGFFKPYDTERNGVAIEPWHLSYKPLSQSFFKLITLKKLTKVIIESDILGKDVIIKKLPKILSQYVRNVNKGTHHG